MVVMWFRKVMECKNRTGQITMGECGKKFTLSMSLSKVKAMKGKCCYSGLCNRKRELSTCDFCELMWTRISSRRRNARSNALHASLKIVVK